MDALSAGALQIAGRSHGEWMIALEGTLTRARSAWFERTRPLQNREVLHLLERKAGLDTGRALDPGQHLAEKPLVGFDVGHDDPQQMVR